MHRQNPNCHWCGQETTLQLDGEQGHFPTLATFDHLYSKFTEERKGSLGGAGVLACYTCNFDRGRKEFIAQKPKWHQWLIKLNLHKIVFWHRRTKWYNKLRYGRKRSKSR